MTRSNWNLALAPLLILFSCGARAADYCALTISITDPAGEPVDLPVAVYDESGVLFASIKALNGAAKVCDLGFDMYRIEVGDTRACNHVTISNVRDLLTPQNIKVIRSWCGGDKVVPRNGCELALRVRDEKGAAINHARLSVREGGTPMFSDGYGRIFAGMLLKTKYTFTISADAHQSQTFDLTCTTGAPIRRVVVLATETAH